MINLITAKFRFFAELNDFLVIKKRKRKSARSNTKTPGLSFEHQFAEKATIKDIIESLGVPHGEVDLILVNGQSVDFNYQVKANDSVSVYPVFEAYDIQSVTHLRPKPLRKTRFILDVHLGKLARYLRLFGFDTFYDTKVISDNAIVNRAIKEKRIILTRDVGLLKNKKVTHGYWLRNTNPTLQIKEIMLRFHLEKNVKPFTRCIECNGELKIIKHVKRLKNVPLRVKSMPYQFNQCVSCKRVYWQGSHHAKLTQFVDKIVNSLSDQSENATCNMD